jgi:hypothetical protein
MRRLLPLVLAAACTPSPPPLPAACSSAMMPSTTLYEGLCTDGKICFMAPQTPF